MELIDCPGRRNISKTLIDQSRRLAERNRIMKTRALLVLSVAVLLAGCYAGYAPYPTYSSSPGYYHYSDRSDYRGGYYYH
jgi:hypothetical protein